MADLGVLTVQVKPDLGGFSQQVSSAMASVGSSLSRVAVGVGQDLAAIGGRLAAGAGLAAGALAVIGIKTAAGLETATLQFQTLLGSADEAQAKVAQLFEFAKKTPFESGPIIEASRRLQVFGGDALNTEESLTRIGDAAAAVAAPIEEVAFWVGRAYSQIKGGQPFGEAAMRLQELGVLTPEVRTEMENLAAAGADSEQVFAQLEGQLDQFTGAMELQANTLTGLTSTIKDQFQIGLAEAFKPAFETLKDFLSVIRDFGDSDAFAALTASLAGFLSIIRDQLAPYIERFRKTMENLTPADTIGGVEKASGFLLDLASAAKEVYDTLGPLVPILAGAGVAITSTFANAIPLVGQLFPQISILTGALLGFTLGIDGNREALFDFLQVIGSAAGSVLPQLRESFATIGDSLSGAFQAAIRNLTPAIEYLVTNLVPTLADVFAQLGPPITEVIDQLSRLASSIITGAGPMFEALAEGVGAVLASGLEVLADVLGLLADNASVAVPLITGLATAFAAFKVANAISNIKGFETAIGGIKQQVAGLGGVFSGRNSGVSFFGAMKNNASAAATAVTGLGVSLKSLGIGLAITAGMAALTSIFTRQSQEADRAKEAVGQYADNIRSLGTEEAAQTAFRDAAEEGEYLADVIERLPGGLETAGSAIAGNTEDWARLRGAVNESAAALAESENISLEAAQALLNDELSALEGNFSRAQQGADALTTSEEAAAQQADIHRQSISDLRYELDALFSSQLNVAQSQTRYQEGFLRLNEALAAAQGNLSGTTRESLAARSAFEAQAQGLMDLVSAQASEEQSAAGAAAAGQLLYQQLYNTAIQYGMTDQEAREYLATLGLTPDSIDTQANLAAEQAKEEARGYQGDLNDIDNTNPSSSVTLSGDAEARSRLRATKDDADALAGDYRIRVIVEGANTSWNPQDWVQVPRTVRGTPMMGSAEPTAGLMAADATIAVRPRVYDPSMMTDLAPGTNVVIPVIEQRTYLGQTEVTDVVKTETVAIERDRSMKYLTGVH